VVSTPPAAPVATHPAFRSARAAPLYSDLLRMMRLRPDDAVVRQAVGATGGRRPGAPAPASVSGICRARPSPPRSWPTAARRRPPSSAAAPARRRP
jgi:hypothetical protein